MQAGQRVGQGAADAAGVEGSAEADVAAHEFVLGAQLAEQAGQPAHRGGVVAGDAQVEVAQRAVLGLERALELLGFDDRVGAGVERVAAIALVEAAFATLEQPPGAAVYAARVPG